jgi:hypothetical protein
MNITIKELKRLKLIIDQLEACAELVGTAYYDAGYASIYDIEEDGFNVSISLPREDEAREFVSWDEFLSEEWALGLLKKIENQKQQKLDAIVEKQLKDEQRQRALYDTLKQKFEPNN